MFIKKIGKYWKQIQFSCVYSLIDIVSTTFNLSLFILMLHFSFFIFTPSSFGFLTKLCRYWCKKCNKRFSSQIKLVDHMSSPEHNNPKTARWKKSLFLLVDLSYLVAGRIQERAHQQVLIKAAPPQLHLCSRVAPTIRILKAKKGILVEWLSQTGYYYGLKPDPGNIDQSSFVGKRLDKRRYI